MPLYEYRCPRGHVTERLRKFVERDDLTRCATCDAIAPRILSAHHAEVDGIYSYAPNLGDPSLAERAHARREP